MESEGREEKYRAAIEGAIPCGGYHYQREAYVFRTPCGEEKTVAWSEPHGGAMLTFAPADRVRVVDRHGQVSFVDDGGPGDGDGVRNGAVELDLSADPAFVSVQ